MNDYIPQAGDKVEWLHNRVGYGSVKGEVDYVESMESRTAIVFIPPSKFQHGEDSRRRTRIRKTFDQLTLLERPGVDT